MKFTIGYQADDIMKRTVLRLIGHIGEVYFPYYGFTTGRGTPTIEQQAKMEADLVEYVQAGLKGNLLLNGNCYGARAQARSLFNKIGDAIDHSIEKFALSSITTTSPIIAKFVKMNFPDIEVRASVNMEIGSAESMAYLAEHFDGFYAKREFNWSISRLQSMKKWCEQNGKKLYILANSGCLNFCPARTFHDNLVAHQHEIAEMDNAFEFHGMCHDFLKNKESHSTLLRRLNFIRPEDTYLFEDLCDGIKLATRTSRNPSAIIEAYCSKKFGGNILDLTEPSHSGHLYPSIIDNSKIPQEYAQNRLNCTKNCEACGYCNLIQKNATITLDKTEGIKQC